MAEAVRDAVTDSPWGPYIWFMLAGRRGACAVAAELLVHGGPDICWRDSFGRYVTTGVTDAFDEGLGMAIDAGTFGQVLDGWYSSFGAEYWREVGIDEVIGVVSRFPASRSLRWHLWERARQEGRPDALGVVDASARSEDADAAADQLVAEGERLYLDGDLDGARGAFLAAIRELPTHAEAWCDLGVVMHAQGDLGAGDAFDCALAIDPDHQDALRNRDSWRALLGQS
jgi:tetratricopeptide (TPR) repeat protein